MNFARKSWRVTLALGWLVSCRSGVAQNPPGRPDTTKSRDSADSTKPKRKPADSAIHLLLSTRLPGRGQNDSISLVAAIRKGLGHPGWPVRGPAALPGSILPARRIVAFYGNPLSPRMGILGELAPAQMLARFDSVIAQWRAADPGTQVQPALHLITVVAQENPGRDGRYRLRMDSTLIAKVYAWAQARHAILILDVQAGQSTVREELPRLLPWLARPDVHLALDPEFYMHYNREGKKPGTRIGTMDAADVNYAIEELGKLVTQYALPPKVLIVHRFTQSMLRNASQVRLDPRVQLVINMDGWGQPWLKFDTYAFSEIAEPVQYTGFKLFFHHDTRKGDLLLTPREVLALRPRPMYIQYQ